MSVLDRYVVRAILSSVLLVMLVVLVLGALFVFIDQQDDIGTGHYTALSAFWYTLLNLPQLAYELLPIDHRYRLGRQRSRAQIHRVRQIHLRHLRLRQDRVAVSERRKSE